MSSILLLLDDGEMQQLGTNSGGRIVLAGNQGDPGGQFSDAVITSADGVQLTLGSHFLTTTDGAGGEQVRAIDTDVVSDFFHSDINWIPMYIKLFQVIKLEKL